MKQIGHLVYAMYLKDFGCIQSQSDLFEIVCLEIGPWESV